MVDDTFVFSIANPASAAFFDILSGNVKLPDESLPMAIVENSSIDYDHNSVMFSMSVKNTGETAATKTISLIEGVTVLETEPLTLNPGETLQVNFNNGGAFYNIPNGSYRDFTVKSE